MNFLGHLLLTYPHREITMGNLLGDMVRRKETQTFSGDLRLGISLHHEIDASTDQHPGIRELIAMLRPNHGKYAPVVVDILLDHVLARHWSDYGDISYGSFTQWVYDLIPDYLNQLPDAVSARLERMVAHRWIDGYHTTEKLEEVLMRMDIRARFPSQFVQGGEDYRRHSDVFHATFAAFYGPLRERIVALAAQSLGA